MRTSLPFTEAEIESSLIARWRRVVEHFPEQIAVSTVHGERYSYQALDQAANPLAQALLASLGPDNGPVILLLGHSLAMITSILATLKAHKAYVAFDPTQPAGQLQLLYEATAASLIVTDHEHQALAQAIAPAQGQIWRLESLPATDPACPSLSIPPDAIAGIFFTSGTVKQPKGVPRTHRTILHRAWFGANLCHFGPGDRISGIRQCGLGGGVADVFNALLSGATYCLYPLQTLGLQGLSAWLQAEQITYFHPPIVLFRQWLDTLGPDALFPHLRQILPSGRKSSADLARLWPHVSNHCVVLTSYSATETTEITCTVLDRFTPTDEGVLHVGQPLPGKQVLVMRPDGQPAAVGEVGEIVVRSRYISTGYWRQPELTAQRFRPAEDGSGEICYFTGDLGRRRVDGHVELVGRQDSQVKLRGYRIVLGEVEDALQALPSVKAAVVTADEERGLLVAYLRAAIEPPAPPAAIRAALAQRLPHYVLPTHVIYLTDFPLLASGKVNRQALPPPEEGRPALETPYVAPRSPLEERLAAIWEAVLHVQPIGIHDSFVDLGGNSLRAMRLMVELERALAIKAPLETLFRHPTIAHQAHYLNQVALTASPPPQDEQPVPLATPVRSPEQEQVFQRIYAEIGQPDAAQSWQQPHQAVWRQRRQTQHAALRLLPYRWAVNLLAWNIQQPWVQRRYYRYEMNMLEQFLRTTDSRYTHAQVVTDFLFYGCFDYYRLVPWGNRAEGDPTPNPLRWIEVNGQEIVDQASAQGRGVLLLRSHISGSAFFANLPLKSYRIRQLKRHLSQWQLNGTVTESLLFAHQLNTAREVLEKGGLVNISADGRHGNSPGILSNFLGRQRAFHTSFAELALLTGAAVVVVDVTLNRQGRAKVSFVGPLDAGAAHEPYAQRVEWLVRQYVTFCQAKWQNEPWLIPWYQLTWHLAAPHWSQAAGS